MCGSLRHDEIVKELEALTGKKDSRCGGHNGHRAKSRDIMAAEYGFSSRTAARMLRLNYLIPEFKKLVDEGSVALLAAVDMSFLEEGEQQAIWNLLNRQGLKLKPKAATELRKHGGELTEERIVEILDALSINKRSGNQFMTGTLDKEVYQSRRADLTRKADRLDAEIAELEAKYHEAEVIQDDGVPNALETLDKFSDATELDQDIVGALIEKVLVYDPRHVEIRWKFSDEVLKLLQG